MISDSAERHDMRAERQGGGHDHEAQGLVEDDRLERGEAEGADEERQAGFRAPEADQAPKDADGASPAERPDAARLALIRWEPCFHGASLWSDRHSGNREGMPRQDAPLAAVIRPSGPRRAGRGARAPRGRRPPAPPPSF